MPWSRMLGTSSVPVLCYHNIGGNGVPLEAFKHQMRWLARAGAATLGLDDLRTVLDGLRPDRPSVCITFDDGFRDLYTRVAPVLREHGFRAVVFAISGRLRPDDEPGTEKDIVADEAHRAFVLHGDRSAWLSRGELAALSGEGLLDVGSHSASHAMGPVSPPELADIPDHWAYAPWQDGRQSPPAPRLAPEFSAPLWNAAQGRPETDEEMHARVTDDLRRSRTDLEAFIGRPVTAFAWPWGKSHPVSARAARDAGLDLVFPLARGPVCAATPRDAVPRLEVRRRKGPAWFASRMFIYSRATVARLYSAARI